MEQQLGRLSLGSVSAPPIETRFVPRPGFGTTGRAVTLRANYFELTAFPRGDMFHYDVTVLPDVPPAANRRVFVELEKIIMQQFGGVRLAYDGRKSMYTARPLAGLGNEPRHFDISLTREDGSKEEFKVAIKLAAQVNMESLVQYLTGENRSFLPYEVLQALDVLMRQGPTKGMESIGRSLYTGRNASSLGGAVEAWNGFYQSVRPAAGKLLLNVDVSATVFYEPGPLLDSIGKLLNKRGPEEMLRGILASIKYSFAGLSKAEIDRATKAFKGLKVEITYRGAQYRRNYRVLGFTIESAANSKFFNEDQNREMSVAEFFAEHYNKPLQYHAMPCVRVGSPKKMVLLPIEFCNVPAGQTYKRRLDENQTANMIKVTATRPADRANRILAGRETLQHDNNPYLEDFGVRISTEMVQCQAHVLEVPTIKYHPSSREATIRPRDGGWNLRDKKVPRGATLNDWAVVCFGSTRDFPQNVVEPFLRELIETSNATGVTIERKMPPVTFGSPLMDIEATLKDAFQNLKRATGKEPQMIVCLLPQRTTPLYAEIKRVSDTVLGIPTQCILGKHTRRPNKQYCANVSLKINAKLGGVNAELVQGLPMVSDRPTIVFGADVTHPAPGDLNKPSVCALVGSMNASATQYAAAVRAQASRLEIIQDLKEMARELLVSFYRSTGGRKPERIIFFRDGVSEGQFDQVMQQEVTQLQQACMMLEKDYLPPITFIVVQKRHHVRFFPPQGQGDRNGNILPGTVVDRDVTHPFEFDFFLNSHGSLQGTSRPAHYYVLRDENKFTPDALQQMIFNFSHVYAKATRSVSVCPPAYYADLLAFRARYHSKGGWQESTASERSDQTAGSFGVVPEALRKTMYFM